jgi:hypothetical protein
MSSSGVVSLSPLIAMEKATPSRSFGTIIAIPEKARCLDAATFSDQVMATFEASAPRVVCQDLNLGTCLLLAWSLCGALLRKWHPTTIPVLKLDAPLASSEKLSI